jgi:hypothetical protein
VVGTVLALSNNKKLILGLIVIVLAQLIILPRTAPYFFDGDAFYYFAHHLESWESFKNIFLAPDKARQYRPLGQILFSYVFYPLFKLDFSLYGATALTFHILNTLLIFLIFKRILKSTISIIAATAFWGLHPVAIFITHSFSFLADFTFVFFYFLAVYSFLKYIDTGRRVFGFGVLVAFIFSMGCKEAAVTLPAALIFLAIGFLSEDADPSLLKSRTKWLLYIMFGGLAIFLAGYLWMKGGKFYDTGDQQNYFFSFSIETIIEKLDFLISGFFLPFPENRTRPGVVVGVNRLALFIIPFLLTFFLHLAWPGIKKNRKIWFGFFLSILLMTPVLFIRPNEFVHNIYLPMVGFAIATGIFIDEFSKILKQSGWLRPEFFYVYCIAIVISSLLVNQEVFKKINWRPNYESIARGAVEALQKSHPKLPKGSILYMLRSTVPAFPWLLYDGLFFKWFRHDQSLTTRFQEWNEPFPFEEVKQGRGFALAFADAQFYDLTKDYIEQISDGTGISLLNHFDQANVYMSHSPGGSSDLGTPDNKVAFIATVVKNHEARIAMISLALSKVRIGVPVLNEKSRLVVGTGMRFDDVGDGAEGRIYYESGDNSTLIYSKYIDPKNKPEDRVWFDEVIPLGQFAGTSGILVFECAPGPQGNAIADWYMWSRMRVEGVNTSAPTGTQ